MDPRNRKIQSTIDQRLHFATMKSLAPTLHKSRRGSLRKVLRSSFRKSPNDCSENDSSSETYPGEESEMSSYFFKEINSFCRPEPSRGCLKFKTLRESIVSTAARPGDENCRDCDSSAKERRVSFTQIRVNTHYLTLGDNPCAHDGPPLSIEWGSCNEETLTVEDYEAIKNRYGWDSRAVGRFPGCERTRILRARGFERKELKKVKKEMKRIQRSRDDEIYLMEEEVFLENQNAIPMIDYY